MKPTALYRHYDKDGNLLYIGISLSAIARFQQHRNNSHWAKDAVKMTTEWFDTRKQAEVAEKLAIQKEQPIHNKVYNKHIIPNWDCNLKTIMTTLERYGIEEDDCTPVYHNKEPLLGTCKFDNSEDNNFELMDSYQLKIWKSLSDNDCATVYSQKRLKKQYWHTYFPNRLSFKIENENDMLRTVEILKSTFIRSNYKGVQLMVNPSIVHTFYKSGRYNVANYELNFQCFTHRYLVDYMYKYLTSDNYQSIVSESYKSDLKDFDLKLKEIQSNDDKDFTNYFDEFFKII